MSGLNGPQNSPRKNAEVTKMGRGGRIAMGRMLAAVPIRIVLMSVRCDMRALIHP